MLGSGGKPWEFLPVAARALEAMPRDAALVVLAAANLASLGLKTVAGECLETLVDDARRIEEAVRLREIIERLPPDRITTAERIGSARVNLEAIVDSHPQVAARCRGVFSSWESRVDEIDCYRATDGNMLRRPSGRTGLSSCLSLIDQRSQSRALAVSVAPATEMIGRPIVVEGVCPPWVFMELMAATDREFVGHRRRVILVQADAEEFLDGLSLADLRAELSQPRLELHVGEGAPSSLACSLANRLDTALVGKFIPVLATRRACSPPVQSVLSAAESRQSALESDLRRRVEAVYAPRDRPWWHKRYACGGPLRVLLRTSRYTTYVRHSTEDLARAFERAGHVAHVYMEPDDHSTLSAVATLRRVAEFDPDLVVLINYPRATMADVLPANVPMVCWVQDAMPHLFDSRVGSAHGPMDFVVGVRIPELVTRFGYPAERCLPMPVVVSPEKFSSGPVGAVCRVGPEPSAKPVICFVTHHGETPERMHDRLKEEASRDPVLTRLMDRLWPAAVELAAKTLSADHKRRIRMSVIEAVREEAGSEAPERVVSMLTHAYINPVIDRMLRHQTAAWAASIASRRGWTFVLHGRNWDHHPTLSAYAAGGLGHGDSLRESYARSTVHLHASLHGPMHQRVFECSLSGGLALCRTVWPTVWPLVMHAQREVRRRLADRPGSAGAVESGFARVPAGEHSELAEASELIGRIGLETTDDLGLNGWWSIPMSEPVAEDIESMTWPLVRPIAGVSFKDEAQLEHLIERAVVDPAWREAGSSSIARPVRASLTHDALAAKITDLVASGMA